MNESHISLVDVRSNANTRLLSQPGPCVDASEVHEAYERARGWAAGPAPAPGYRLVWVRGHEMGMRDLPAPGVAPEPSLRSGVPASGAYVVVGRHTQCDAVLRNDAAIALRHLLARTVRLDDGTLALRLFDLHTSLGFFLDDDVERRAIVATGPLAVRIGRYVLVALPTGEAPPSELPVPAIHDSPCVPTSAQHLRGESRTHVTTIPPAPLLDEAMRAMQPGPGRARITLRRDGRAASIELSDAALETGVLIGRADRCVDGGLRSVLTETVSRVHLLLLRENGAVHAYDVASTQGTYADGKHVHRVRLPDSGASLILASANPVLFDWHPRG
jgi:hypothetical protein